MKLALKCISALVSVGLLAGCSSTGTLTPTATADITTAYTDVCAALPAFGPITSTMNANAKNAYSQATAMCALGAPTNAVTAGFDILAIELALLPYFGKAQPATVGQAKALKHLKAHHAS